uniref:hydroxyethylthiazole kinase n=1 Tax=Staphylococcus auricularis TaxID=29379 RepID=UPI00177DFDE3
SIGGRGNEKGRGIVLEGVGVGGCEYGKGFSGELSDEIDVGVIKGNGCEIERLMDSERRMKGRESGDDVEVVEIGGKGQERLNRGMVVSGKDDVVEDEGEVIKVCNG